MYMMGLMNNIDDNFSTTTVYGGQGTQIPDEPHYIWTSRTANAKGV